MNRISLVCTHVAELVDRLSYDVQYSTKSRWANRNGDRTSAVDSLHSTNQSLCRFHRYTPTATLTQVLLYFNGYFNRFWNVETVADYSRRIVYGRKLHLADLY